MNVAFVGPSESPLYQALQSELVGFPFFAVDMAQLHEYQGFDVAIALDKRWGRDELVDLPISLLQRFGAGVDNVDLEVANQLGIWVANVPSLPSNNADSVADLALYLLLGVARNAKLMESSISSGDWAPSFGAMLKGKTACIVGMGGVGLSVAQRLHGFGMRLIGVRKNPNKLVPEDLGFERVYGSDELKVALARSYCVMLCASGGAETDNMIGQEELEALPSGGVLVNVGRGSLVDEGALLEAIESGQLAGAGLDVFREEPLSNKNPLANHPRVLSTPHSGGHTREAISGIAAHIGANLRQFAAGKCFGSLVNDPYHPRVKLS